MKESIALMFTKIAKGNNISEQSIRNGADCLKKEIFQWHDFGQTRIPKEKLADLICMLGGTSSMDEAKKVLSDLDGKSIQCQEGHLINDFLTFSNEGDHYLVSKYKPQYYVE